VISICGLAKDSNCASAHVSLSIYLDIISYILLYVHRYIDHVPAPVFGHVFLKRLWSVLKRRTTQRKWNCTNIRKFTTWISTPTPRLLNIRSPPSLHYIIHVYTDYTDIQYTIYHIQI